MMITAALIAALTLAQAQPPAAAPRRDLRGPSHGTAAISGTIVSDDADARPIRRARVTCTGPDLARGRTTISDDRGRFAFTDLPAGRYNITATREGWVTMSHGAKRPMRPGSAIPVADGERATVALRMLRAAVITGTITDADGQPSIGVAVRAMRYGVQNGERRLVTYGSSATTDDRGAYRIYNLPPGDYIVGASGRNTFLGQSTALRLTTDLDVRHAQADPQQDVPVPPDKTVAISSTYYPGTAVSTQAGLVPLRAGEERGGIDFALQMVATARVEGTVSMADGSPLPAGVQLNLMALGQTAFPGVAFDGFKMSRAAPDGTFSFSDVSPGQYSLLARAVRPGVSPAGGGPAGPPQVVWAATDLAIEGDSISGIGLSLEPGMTVSGQVRAAGESLTPPDFKTVRVSLQPVQTAGTVTMAPGPAPVDADGRFTLTGVMPGRYRLTALLPGAGRPGSWLVRSSVINGQDTLDVPYVLQPGQSVADAAITLTDHLAQLTGALQNAAGGAAPDYTVVLFPADQALWTPQSRRIQGVRPAADGTYVFRNLPSGTYLLGAVDDAEPGEWFDPAFLQAVMPAAMKIEIADGEKKTQDVRLGG